MCSLEYIQCIPQNLAGLVTLFYHFLYVFRCMKLLDFNFTCMRGDTEKINASSIKSRHAR